MKLDVDKDLYYFITIFGLFGFGGPFFDLEERGFAAAAVAAATALPKLESGTGTGFACCGTYVIYAGAIRTTFPLILTFVLNGLVTLFDTALRLFED